MKLLCTPGPSCHDGIVHCVDSPPPVVPSKVPVFHTFSTGAGPTESSWVPPTDVTPGWLAGSSTSRLVLAENPGALQSSDPESPAAARKVCPWAAACCSRFASTSISVVPASGSHSPQLVVST